MNHKIIPIILFFVCSIGLIALVFMTLRYEMWAELPFFVRLSLVGMTLYSLLSTLVSYLEYKKTKK